MLIEKPGEIYFGEDDAEEITEEAITESPVVDEAETIVGDINPAMTINVENDSSQSQPEITIESPELEPETEPEADPEADLDQENNDDNKNEPNFA